ncbi:hypothetical protein QR680_002042 [Steinernema hermaphroditum]|uniref:Uncharacterized protein n=1 Tax=Steinernema hermaphroditum TaxID=289476 RepID=A0AA39LHD5_9BILA|nr:hypothetical protein QR680_002042 [Steinernema hermaphroditum]
MATGPNFPQAAVPPLVDEFDTIFGDPFMERVLQLMLSKKKDSYSKLYHLHLEVVEQFRTLEVNESSTTVRRKSSSEETPAGGRFPGIVKKKSFRRASVDPNQKFVAAEKQTVPSRRAASTSRNPTSSPSAFTSQRSRVVTHQPVGARKAREMTSLQTPNAKKRPTKK